MSLVLSRKIGERVRIGKDVWVEVRRVHGNQVRLAFHAPKEVRIAREEVDRAAKTEDVGSA